MGEHSLLTLRDIFDIHYNLSKLLLKGDLSYIAIYYTMI